MQRKVNVRPLKGEFWPLEGVVFDDDDSFITVKCNVYGSRKFKDHINLRFLQGCTANIAERFSCDSLYSVVLKGSVSSVNSCLLGLGLVFKKDFISDEDMTVDVEGDRYKYSFLIGLN